MVRLGAILISVVLVAVFVASGCTKIKVPGNVAGQVLGPGGAPQGFISVQLFDTATSAVSMVETSSDTGNFMFKGADPGKYIIKTIGIGGGELPNDCKEFTLTAGKTVNIEVHVIAEGGEAPPAE